MNEFDVIKTYFQQHQHRRSDVVVGSGDDCAVLAVPPGKQLVMTVDTMLTGQHFMLDVDPADLAYKAVAVSLSDVAAMGAEPAWLMATMSLESIDEAWLQQFCRGFFTLVDRYDMALVGGDLTRGPLAVTSHITGFVPIGGAMTRAGSRPGDLIYVTGTLGDAGLALQALLGNITLTNDELAAVCPRLHRPEPRVTVGMAIRELATAAIDISDGLAADLGHICQQSGVGARIMVEQLPRSVVLTNVPDKDLALQLAVSGGDDYELCFTVPADKRKQIELLALDCQITCIGEIIAGDGVQLFKADSTEFAVASGGFQHF